MRNKISRLMGIILILVIPGSKDLLPSHPIHGTDSMSESGPQKPVQSGYVEVEGGKLYYEAAGAGETIVLIHDGLVHREIWDAQFSAFARKYRVIRYDRQGYGLSPKPEKTYSIIEDLYGLFEEMKIERAAVMGMSMGGGLAIDFTLAHPERVRMLVLVGAVVSGLGYTEHMASRGGHLSKEIRGDPEAYQKYWIEQDPYEIAPSNTEAKIKVKRLVEANLHNYETAKHRLNKGPARPALKALKEINVPTLIVVGEFDIPDVHAHAGAINAGIAGSERVIIPGAGHLVPLEQPEVFTAKVLAFMEESQRK
jgi:pimeloyl-ACP methyl ester carboxylesterase